MVEIAVAPAARGDDPDVRRRFQCVVVLLLTTPALAQVDPAGYGERYVARMSIEGGLSTLGTGAEVTVKTPYRFDVRAVGNYTDLNLTLNRDGFHVIANVSMANAGAAADLYPWKSLRLSGGYLYHNTNSVSASVQAQPGITFTLNNVTYTSDNADPVRGSGRLTMGGSGFMATTGWGHFVSRNERHWHFPFEAGVALINKPAVTVNLAGEVCAVQGYGCLPVTTYPGLEANLNAQVASWNRTAAAFHIYPVASFGVSYSFRLRRY